jgi:hypothetical protein
MDADEGSELGAVPHATTAQPPNPIRRHHARLQSEKDTRDLKAGEPLVTTPGAGQEPWWETQSPQPNPPSPASTGGVPDDLDGVRPCAEPRQTHRAPRQPYRKRPGTLAHKIRELLKAHVIRRGPANVLKLERIAKNEGLLQEDQTISRCSTFRRAMKELNIESHRIGYGPRAYSSVIGSPPKEKAPPEVGPKAGLGGCGTVWQPRKRASWHTGIDCPSGAWLRSTPPSSSPGASVRRQRSRSSGQPLPHTRPENLHRRLQRLSTEQHVKLRFALVRSLGPKCTLPLS